MGRLLKIVNLYLVDCCLFSLLCVSRQLVFIYQILQIMASLTSPSCTVRTVCSVNVLLTRCLHARGSSFNTHQNLRAREDNCKDSFTRKRSVLHSLRKKLNQSPDHIVRLLELPENARLSSCEDIRIGSRGSVRVAREVGLVNYHSNIVCSNTL